MALRYNQSIKKISLNSIDSPIGTEKCQAFIQLEATHPAVKFNGEKAVQKIMISLIGYASEILFLNGSANIGGDDLRLSANLTEELLKFDDYKNWVETLPAPSVLDKLLFNPITKTYIDFKIGECVEVLAQVRPLITSIAEELYCKGELSGHEVLIMFNSYMLQSK